MRYFIELSYKGKHYHGWQLQPNAVSVQGKINEALSKITGESIATVAAGRTDTGVHASQMFVHVDVESFIDTEAYLYKFNAVLPEDIVIQKIRRVRDDAHARFHAISRSYEYKIYLGRNPFLLDTTWQLYRQKLNVSKMNEAAQLLLTHTQFQCFSKSKTDVKTYDCDITKAVWILEGKHLSFHITADRFLRNMVRAIVGTLVAVGKEKITLADFKEVLKSRERSRAGTSAPAQGLSLTAVTYPENLSNV